MKWSPITGSDGGVDGGRTIIGGSGDDDIDGGEADDTLDGRLGNDEIRGRDGSRPAVDGRPGQGIPLGTPQQ
ncbi:MAG: hypothetical protein GY798_35385 [Hyphomicrobiales bacterium]|nr:hypothetical protein [Hyphomicrobiales bacterium]